MLHDGDICWINIMVFSFGKFSLQQKLSTGAGIPLKEDDYPPLPDYNANHESESKEVFIIRLKGLPWSCTPAELMDFFSDCRIHDGVNGIHLTLNRSGKPNGQAFIELEHEEDVPKALERHRQYLGPRYVEVYEVTNSEAETLLKKSALLPPPDGVVKLRGLPYSCTEKDVIQFFPDLEIIAGGVTLVRNHRGRSSGNAYVEFVSQEMADKALLKDREVMGNRYIEVFSSRKSEVHSQYGQRGAESPISNRSVHAGQPHPQPENGKTAAVSMSNVDSGVLTHCVHMRGLPFQASGRDIVNFFSPLRPAKILIEYGPDGRLTGEADVYFTNHDDAVSAMSKDKAHMQERYIELFLNSLSTKSEDVEEEYW
ncbi:hypothetical protein AAFF_G00431930 [Aldrovandia affinis]|uniref:RRM domain-containing protein n=1 Tax=Aldrovandia affinis TaxID=143900 RepID=A0AAD7S8S5_9TELE|nr:hypothetical protein AAFF_G00431930 [Aldrovandia affinis]